MSTGAVGATALGCTLPAATEAMGATPLHLANMLNCVVGADACMLGPLENAAKEAT